MSLQALHVLAAYAVSAAALLGVGAWIVSDGRARRREMSELKKAGARRRSDRAWPL